MTVEAQPNTPQTQPELFELPLTERFAAWNLRLNALEGERMRLFKEGEYALGDGLQKLGLETDRANVTRRPLTIPDWNSGYAYNNRLPNELSGLIEAIHLREHSSKASASAWMDIAPLPHDELTLGVNVGDENFELRMRYERQTTYYLSRYRPDNEIVAFSGNSTRGFEKQIDRFKDLNRADTNTKLGAALALIKFVADLRQV
jgi:hypothetical protein